MSHEFSTFELTTACLSENCDERFPTALATWNQEPLRMRRAGTHFGFVQNGAATLHTANGEFVLREKMYFCVPGDFSISGGAGFVVTRLGYRGLFAIGGQIELSGRLRYIDGCTDTLLIAPPLLGDPCLNALYFPKNVNQTAHTHPSVRVGIVASGAGTCVLPANRIGEREIPLKTGQAFVIAPEVLHSFVTGTNQEMIVIAYHPDSDFGATHENHPMINKTIVAGVSAANLIDLQT